MQLTNEEIQFIKEMYKNTILIQNSIKESQILDSALQEINNKYKPLLDQAVQAGDLELRKQLIEQQSEEARAKELEMRNTP